MGQESEDNPHADQCGVEDVVLGVGGHPGAGEVSSWDLEA